MGKARFNFSKWWSQRTIYDRALLYLVIFSLALRLLWLEYPKGTLIFDEFYYVNVAKNLLGLSQVPGENGNVPYPDAEIGTDPNIEHPPLAKLLIALFMLIFGDNPYGWRLASVFFGIASIVLIYAVVKKASAGNERLALLSSFIFSFDNLVFVHSRIATLDIFMLTFMLLGFYYLVNEKYVYSAIAFSLSTLCKMGGVYALLAALFYLIIKLYSSGRLLRKGEIIRKEDLQKFEKLIITYGISFLFFLFIMDLIWVGYNNPFDHLAYILHYTATLTRPEGLIDIESYPWQWLFNEVKIPYATIESQVLEDSKVVKTFPIIVFTGAMNPALIFLTIPAIAYCIHLIITKKESFSMLIVSWFALTYLPFYPMAIFMHRITYIFYFLPTVPAVAIATAKMFDEKMPKIVVLAYLIAILLGFAYLFPFKQAP
jgi:predicted membrane-bound dolichyl-phosphate-mannose-protein mannosyltransferase